MILNRFFRTMKSGPTTVPRPRPAVRLSVEALDDRIVPAKLFVGDAVIVEGNVGAQYARVNVGLDAPSKQTVSVNFATADGTAKAGSDYDAATGKLTFAPGQTYKTILIPVRGDRFGELDTESFLVKLSRASRAQIADGQGVVTIFDDEPRIMLGTVTAYEGDLGARSFTIPVTLGVPELPYYEDDAYPESHAYDEAVTVSFDSQDGTAVAGVDYLAISGTLTFAPGETIKFIDLAVYGDRLVEGDEKLVVNISGAPNAVIYSGQSTITIADNEPAISILDAIGTGTFDEPTFTFTFTVYLSNLYDEPVTVNFATADGTAIAGVDYVATSETLTFAPGERFKTITVEATLYPTDMLDKYLYVRLSDPSANAYFADELAYGFFYYYDSGGGYSTGD